MRSTIKLSSHRFGRLGYPYRVFSGESLSTRIDRQASITRAMATTNRPKNVSDGVYVHQTQDKEINNVTKELRSPPAHSLSSSVELKLRSSTDSWRSSIGVLRAEPAEQRFREEVFSCTVYCRLHVVCPVSRKKRAHVLTR